MKKTFKFVYDYCPGEIPEATYITASNITNARKIWESDEDSKYELLAILEGDKIRWKGRETNWSLEDVH